MDPYQDKNETSMKLKKNLEVSATEPFRPAREPSFNGYIYIYDYRHRDISLTPAKCRFVEFSQHERTGKHKKRTPF